MSKVSVLHLARIVLMIVLWALCWNQFARWLAKKLSMESTVLLNLKYRVLFWAMLFEAVILIGVLL